MNRYAKGATIGGPSKATASTLCQKCLKRDTYTLPMYMTSNANYSLGHYSYECKAAAQERPYVSRPSRTQQLLNPKLAPKLMSDVPQDLLRKCVIILLSHLASLTALVFLGVLHQPSILFSPVFLY
jgi:hypothetical protein